MLLWQILLILTKREKLKKVRVKEKNTAENRIKFGRTKKEKLIEKQKNERDNDI